MRRRRAGVSAWRSPARRRIALRCRTGLLWLALCTGACAAEPAPTVERLLADGWEVAAFAGNLDVRTALILFRKKDANYLVQCSTLYDVTRSQRVVVNCYELH